MFEDAIRKLRVLILTRALVVTLLVGSFYVFQIGYGSLIFPSGFPYFIVALYILTIAYLIALRWIKTLSLLTIFAYVQIVIDVISEVILIYLTGGVQSWFSFTFLLSIISASIVLNSRASYYIAGLSSILYGLLVELQFYHVLPSFPGSTFVIKDHLFNIFAHITAFYLVAFLSWYLSEKLHVTTRALQQKDADLSDLKALSKDIIENMPSGVFTTDLDWRIITFNRSAEKITGKALTDVMGKTPQEIFPFLKHINIKEQWKRIEGEIYSKDKTKYIGIRFEPLRNSAGEPTGMIGVFQDLTELKAMEAEVQKKEKWAFIGELSALIAHELRNPLASLKASIEMLREKKVSEQHAEHLMEIALSEMDRLNDIVTDFLLYAKPQKLNKNPFDLHQSLRDVITLLRSPEKTIRNAKISEDLKGELLITGDPKQLQQVFWNLGNNAIDAVSEGGEVFISTEKKNNSIEIIFRDTGTGISKGELDKIFYPFFTTKEKGTGLGLSIAQRIIEEHGGNITVESRGSGTGATFKVALPIN